MRSLPKLLFALAMAFAVLWAAPDPASADALDTYRATGVVAERFDGYVEIRDPNAPSDARALVENVNAKRRALYSKRAKESNVPVGEVGKVFANEIAKSAPSGTYFRRPRGDFVRK